MLRIRADAVLSKLFDMKQKDLLSGIVFNVPVPPWEERMLRKDLDPLESVRGTESTRAARSRICGVPSRLPSDPDDGLKPHG